MNKKKKILNAIKRNSQDILPTQIDYTPEMKEKIKDLLGTGDLLIDEKLDNHIKYFFLDDKTGTDKEEGIQYDIWGIGWDRTLTEGFHIRHHPLIESEDLREYVFPVPDEKMEKLKNYVYAPSGMVEDSRIKNHIKKSEIIQFKDIELLKKSTIERLRNVQG